MINKKKLLRSLIAAGIMVSVFTMPGQAATVKPDTKTEQDAQAKVPIVVDAEEVTYNDVSGDMAAKGNVSILQADAKLYGDLIRGNTKQNEVWIDDEGVFVQPGTRLVGIKTHYNYKDKTGTIDKASGKVGHELVTGQQINLEPQKVIIHDGTMTACPAKVPDYHISASRVEIWPGEKMIAYNAKFWIKNTVIYSTPKYQKSLREDASESAFPKVGVNSKDGFSISQHLEYPLTDKLAAYANIAYYTKAEFKPSVGLTAREKGYTADLTYGNYVDGDHDWIKKEPELKVSTAARRLGQLPVSYTLSGLYGKWSDDHKSSWHQDYRIYFTGDPIKFDQSLVLYLGTGFNHIRESYDDSVQNSMRYDATLVKTWSPRFTTWTGYHYVEDNDSLFAYDEVELSRKLDAGFSYKIDRLNTLVYNQAYDLTDNRIHDQDITWRRNLHCWEVDITYRVKRHEWKLDLATIRF